MINDRSGPRGPLRFFCKAAAPTGLTLLNHRVMLTWLSCVSAFVDSMRRLGEFVMQGSLQSRRIKYGCECLRVTEGRVSEPKQSCLCLCLAELPRVGLNLFTVPELCP